jgi:hypothetical protein
MSHTDHDKSEPSPFYAATEGLAESDPGSSVSFYVDVDDRLPYRLARQHSYRLTFYKPSEWVPAYSQPTAEWSQFDTVAAVFLDDGRQHITVLDPSHYSMLEVSYNEKSAGELKNLPSVLSAALRDISIGGRFLNENQKFKLVHREGIHTLVAESRLTATSAVRGMLYAQMLGGLPAEACTTSSFRRMRPQLPNEPENSRVSEVVDFLLQETPNIPEFAETKLSRRMSDRLYEIINALHHSVHILTYEIVSVMGSCHQSAVLRCTYRSEEGDSEPKAKFTVRINLTVLLLSVLLEAPTPLLP